MFNIGGQGQYFIGLIVANWLGVDFPGMSPLPHILLAVGAATLAGAAWAGIAGFLKATVGAHEVITTIMLNWIAIWLGDWLFGDGGPLQNSADKANPISNDVADSAKLPVFWGEQQLQGLHVGFFVALAALVVFWPILNRTTLGYEVRAVGFNPEAAAYGGINVRKNLIRAMAISGAFAGLAGALDMTGYLYHFGQPDIPISSVGFLGIAVALLGRNTAVGVGFGAFLFGALLFGTTHGLTSNVIQPELAGNLTYIIQGLVVLFIGADVLILYFWNARRKLRRGAGRPREDDRMSTWVQRLDNPVSARLRDPPRPATPGSCSASSPRSSPSRRSRRGRSRGRSSSGSSLSRSGSGRDARSARLGWGAVAAGLIGIGLGILATRSGTGNLEPVFDAALIAQTFALRDPARLRRDRRHVLRAQRRREHRPRGDDADGRLLGRLRRRQRRQLGGRHPRRHGASARCSRSCYAYFAIHLRADQIVGGTAVNFLALGITGYFFFQLYNGTTSRTVSRRSRT